MAWLPCDVNGETWVQAQGEDDAVTQHGGGSHIARWFARDVKEKLMALAALNSYGGTIVKQKRM